MLYGWRIPRRLSISSPSQVFLLEVYAEKLECSGCVFFTWNDALVVVLVCRSD